MKRKSGIEKLRLHREVLLHLDHVEGARLGWEPSLRNTDCSHCYGCPHGSATCVDSCFSCPGPCA